MTSTALSLIKAVLARVPGAPDGLRNDQTNGTSEAFTDASTYASIEGHLPLNGRVVQSAPFQPLKEIAHDLIHQVWNGNALKDAVVALQAILSAGSPTDDRELLMEHLVSRLAQMDPEVQLREKITDVFIKGLWEDLPHPVSSLIGDEYRFRQADGSYNNMFEPTLGAAGRPYARSVPPLHPKMPNPPDAELVFNCLLKRDKFVPHPSGISSMLFANAVIIVHSIFRTNYDDPMKNDASGYLDLSPLYGNNLKEQHAVRDMDKCLGLLYNDTVAESRLFLMPPQVVAYLVLFNRNHNYIADMLYKINEKGKFRDPATFNPDDKESVKHFEWQERELFETARLINCGHFIQITLHDYVASILGTNQIETNWFLDPMKEINSALGGKVERGTGNVCASEFNILYRWHSTMSQKDAQWFSDILTEKAGGKPAESLSMMEFLRIAKKEVQEFEVNSDPTEWQIPGHHRDNVTLKYNDDELASILIRSIEEPAAAFRACGIPEAMRPIDCLGIMAARNTYGLCTLNEFRKSLGLREYKTFQEWNEDPEVAAMAEKLYIHPDNLELYPGLLAEGTKPPMLGSGLAVGRTISRAILSDAVALVRGDRFYTTDYNVATLTTWGMEYISPNLSDGSKGGLLGKLFLRNLPRHFEYNSVYALFPFQTPMSMRKYLTQQGTVNNYSFNKPKAQPHWKVISHVQEAIAALRDHTTFLTVYGDKIDNLSMNNYGFMLGFDGKEKHDADRKMINDAIWPAGYDDEYRLFYTRIVQKLIKEHSYKIPGGHTHVLDVVRDVGNLASVYWMATYFGIPLKTKKTPHGIMTPQELYMASAAMFTYVFMDFFDPTVSFKLKGMAERAANTIGKLIEARIKEVQGFSGPLELLIRGSASLIRPGPEALAMYKRLIASGRPMDAMVSSCLGVITAAAQNQGQAFAQSLNVFMSPEHKEAFDNMQAIAPVAGKETDEMFLKYSWEGQRLDPQVPGIPRVARVDTTATDAEGQPFKIGAGDKVWISMTDLNNNPEVWTNPEKIDVSRKANKYTLFSVGMHNCLGSKTVNIAQPVLIREVMKLKNLRRAPGPAGTLKRFTNSVYGTKVHMYFTPTYEPFPFPTSMTVMYEA